MWQTKNKFFFSKENYAFYSPTKQSEQPSYIPSQSDVAKIFNEFSSEICMGNWKGYLVPCLKLDLKLKPKTEEKNPEEQTIPEEEPEKEQTTQEELITNYIVA